MTDREKLLVALLSRPAPPRARGVTTLELMTVLDELGRDYRAMWRELGQTAYV